MWRCRPDSAAAFVLLCSMGHAQTLVDKKWPKRTHGDSAKTRVLRIEHHIALERVGERRHDKREIVRQQCGADRLRRVHRADRRYDAIIRHLKIEDSVGKLVEIGGFWKMDKNF